MKNVKIYTDGACKGNPGPGGWCAILLHKESKKILQGNAAQTTNNRMELMGVLEGLRSLKENCEVEIYTDSNYIYQAFTAGWIANWIKNGWKRKEGKKLKDLKNLELWQEIWDLSQHHSIQWIKVPAHSGIPLNEECDKIASYQASRLLSSDTLEKN